MIVDREAPTSSPRRTTLTLAGRPRRRSRRVAAAGWVALHLGGGEQLSSGRLVELSSSGLRVRCRAHLAPTTAVMGVIELDEIRAPMEYG